MILWETHIKNKFKRIAGFCLHLTAYVAGITLWANAVAQGPEAQIKQEYFVQQKANEALLLRIDTFEAEFESRLLGPAGELLALSGVSESRMAPVFQFVSTVKKPRQLEIAVTSSLHTDRAKFTLGLTRLAVWDDRSEALARAYQQLSYGTEQMSAGSAASWTVKISSLINASKVFRSMGMQELGAWSFYLAAHFIHFQLHDYTIALDMSREILADIKDTRWHEVLLATLQLQSDGLMKLRETGAMRVSASGPDPLQAALLQVAQLADSLGLQYERARAIKKSGTLFAAQSLYPQALEQFQQAAKITDALGADHLSTEIRENIVQILARQGNASASTAVLQQIETQLTEQGTGDELADNLLQQGRLLIKAYHYPLAIGVLTRALQHENNSAIRRQINFELARAFHASGQSQNALSYLQAAGIDPDTGRLQRSNSLVDVAEGLRIMANIYRTENNDQRMQQVRRVQGQFLQQDQASFNRKRASFLYEQGLDQHAHNGRASGQAQNLFRQSYLAADKSGQVHLQNLARLQLCALAKMSAGVGSLCSSRAIQDSYADLIASAVPRQALEAMYLRTRYLQMWGRQAEAIRLADRLINELHFLGITLPGVLAAWYWERHEELFDYYLELTIADEKQGSGKKNNAGLDSLTALSKIRYITRANTSEPARPQEPEAVERIRNLLVKIDGDPTGAGRSGLKKHMTNQLETLRVAFQKKFAFLSRAGLQKYLHSLNRHEAFLTYQISAESAQFWIGRNSKIQRQRISQPKELYAAVEAARKSLPPTEGSAFELQMDRLGERLIAPLGSLLPATIYWIPAGPLLGFPLDAVRRDGQYLAERHSVVNLMSFPSHPNPSEILKTRVRSGSTQPVFVAGHPQDYTVGIANQLQTSREIRAVAELFVGPGLRIVQGAALLADELQERRFQQADLAHLSMPGIIDLHYPWRSSLELSAPGRYQGRGAFSAANIQTLELNASLIFLSSTRLKVGPVAKYAQQLGLVSNFLDAGADVVISRLWTGNRGVSQQLVVDFYRRLQASNNIAATLAATKRHYLIQQQGSKPADWAGFSVFIK